MQKMELKGTDVTVYKEVLDNGLTVYMVPFENKNNYCMHYVIKFGALDTRFVPYKEKEYVKFPDGIAHFLEHKMFESEDGIDPFAVAGKTGTDCNAATGYKYTRYLFEGTDGFLENLDYLISYVNQPYFTDENVEKEKGIVIEEIRQYADLAEVKLDSMIKENIFENDPMRVDVGGSEDSVNKITKEDLYRTYNTFYQPSNSFLVLTGNFDKDKAMNVIKNNKVLREKMENFEIQKDDYIEKKEVYRKYSEIEFKSDSIKCGYSIKIPIDKKNKIEKSMYYSVFINLAFGTTSDFRERAKKEDLYTSLVFDRDSSRDYYVITFYGETEKPKELIEKIKKEIKEFKPTEEALERLKKVWIASEVMMGDEIGEVLENIVTDVIEYGDIIPNRLDIVRGLNIKKLNEVIKNTDFDNATISIIYPKNN